MARAMALGGVPGYSQWRGASDLRCSWGKSKGPRPKRASATMPIAGWFGEHVHTSAPVVVKLGYLGLFHLDPQIPHVFPQHHHGMT